MSAEYDIGAKVRTSGEQYSMVENRNSNSAIRIDALSDAKLSYFYIKRFGRHTQNIFRLQIYKQ